MIPLVFIQNKWQKLVWVFAICFFFGCDSLSTKEGRDAFANDANAGSTVKVMGGKERAEFYAFLVKEMHEQVFLRTPNAGTINSWVNILLQGGSLEGVYRGLVNSVEYAELEKGTANLQAVRFFAEEIALLKYDRWDIDPTVKEEVQKIVKQNLSTSLFRLKRELGDKILSEIDLRKNDRVKLADFFGKLATRLADKDIPFGMEQRNKKDLNYHRKWAVDNSVGLLQWELLNRIHRILNHHGKLALTNTPADAAKIPNTTNPTTPTK